LCDRQRPRHLPRNLPECDPDETELSRSKPERRRRPAADFPVLSHLQLPCYLFSLGVLDGRSCVQLCVLALLTSIVLGVEC